MNLGTEARQIWKVEDSKCLNSEDILAVEEPLEIRLGHDNSEGKRVTQRLTVLMRTPGQDFELALGFLYSEGIIRNLQEVEEMNHWGPALNESQSQNVLRIDLKRGVRVNLQNQERKFYTNSSCGLCGTSSLDAILGFRETEIENGNAQKLRRKKITLSPESIFQLPFLLRKAQSAFEKTGGLHASGLFASDLKLVSLREDIGRHNALDKVIGYALLNGLLPLHSFFLFVSGRISIDLVQKASRAGIDWLGGIGAPSSLAVNFAQENDMTLLGFVRDQRFNIYSGGKEAVCETN